MNPYPKPPARLLTTLEAAAYAGISPATVRAWVRNGTLLVVAGGPNGGRWRFRPEALDAACRANERPRATAVTAPVVAASDVPADRTIGELERATLDGIARMIAREARR